MEKLFYQLEVTYIQTRARHQLVVINRFKDYKNLEKFLKTIKKRNGNEIENIVIKRVNTEIL